MRQIAIIGGGAAGCFCAVNLARMLRGSVRGDAAGPATSDGFHITIYEAGPKLLAKVAVAGGGRCNYTNTFEAIRDLREAYPRGWQFMKRGLKVFSQEDTVEWFRAEGIRPAVQPDHCIFPETQDAMHVVRVLERGLRHGGVEVRTGTRVVGIKADCGYSLDTVPTAGAAGDVSRMKTAHADIVIVTTGGGAVGMLDGLGLEMERPVPSLFTFRIEDRGLRALMGTVVDNAVLRLAGTSFRSEGTLLLTDWGVSGPATLKLSSYAARHLADSQYRSTLLVGWIPDSEDDVRSWIAKTAAACGRKQLTSTTPEGITARLWKHILGRAGIRETMTWAELGNKGASRLASRLTADEYPIEGRCHFKEEFVTCGGVALSNVKLQTLECRTHPGLYFAGEVLDIDAITGGFNLQAAWTGGMAVAKGVAADIQGENHPKPCRQQPEGVAG